MTEKQKWIEGVLSNYSGQYLIDALDHMPSNIDSLDDIWDCDLVMNFEIVLDFMR